jgi:ribosome biogenesis GTPase
MSRRRRPADPHGADRGTPRAASPGEREGRLAALYADRCLVWSEGEEVVCSLRGRFKGHTKPVVGDRLRWVPQQDGSGTVTALLPRASELTRRLADRKRVSRPAPAQVLAANVELLVIVASVLRPPLRPGLLDRFLVAAALSGIAPLICITKLDLDAGGIFPAVQAAYGPLGLPLLGTSLERPASLTPLAQALEGRTSVLVGHSGVGKTSLLNALGGHEMAVGEVEERGRHTTSTARLIPLAGAGFAIDSPGLREFGLHGVAPAELAQHYPDFRPFLGRCRFPDCLHQGEPGCAVREAVERGEIGAPRYANYRKLVDEAAEEARRHAPS